MKRGVGRQESGGRRAGQSPAFRLLCVVTVVLLATSAGVFAEGEKQTGAAAVEKSETGGGCPGATEGRPCCAGCQGARPAAEPAEKAGGCPCQRARKAAQAAKEAAGAQ